MGIILTFKDISGKELLTLNKPNTSDEERLLKDALKLRVHNTIKFNIGTNYIGCRIVSINRKFASSEAFGQNESIMSLVFTVEIIDTLGQSA